MHTCPASAITLFATGAQPARNAPDQSKFEAASVKRTGRCAFDNTLGPGTVVLKGDPLKPILMEAFKVPAGVRAGQVRFLVASAGASGIKGSMTMASLARHLSGRGYGPVQDFTGLNGKYDIELSWARPRLSPQKGKLTS